MPERIQRLRKKGWKKPSGTINCTRPGRWGNPFRVGEKYECGPVIIMMFPSYDEAREHYRDGITPKDIAECLHYYEKYMDAWKRILGAAAWATWIAEIKGKNLMCYCKLTNPCHVDILLKIANQ